jgi:hypothetical protein
MLRTSGAAELASAVGPGSAGIGIAAVIDAPERQDVAKW